MNALNIKHPHLIQGGMGIAISDWKLAKTVSLSGQLGIVSATAINSVLVRRLQDGDKSGDSRRALKAFPNQNIVKEILETYFIAEGRNPETPYKRAPLFQIKSSNSLLQLTVAASFVEVWLAKENHSGVVGVNLLEKVHLPNLASLYGAMLAHVDYVIMGAGIPREIPGVLDLFSENKLASLKIPVAGSNEDTLTFFDPIEVLQLTSLPKLKRPYFFPIVSSAVLAANLKKKSTGQVDGFIVEGPLAGGHNAPPRGPLKLSESGEPIYSERDAVDLKDMVALGLPFWMAGHYATPEKFQQVLNQGAHGIQVGTLFAFCNESGLDPVLKSEAIKTILNEPAPEGGWIFTDPNSSPTGFPFKAARLPGSISESQFYNSRKRICDLGYLRHAFKKEDGSIGQRCPAEPVADYLKKGGKIEETVGKKCLCNALMADIGMGQIQSNKVKERHLLTAGDDLNFINRIIGKNKTDFSANDVIGYLLENIKTQIQTTEKNLMLSASI